MSLSNGEAVSEVAADVGGTFTDVVLVSSDGTISMKKVLSTPPVFEQAVLQGLRLVWEASGAGAQSARSLYHATTVVTNAILEGRGSQPALIGTKGFRDILEMGTGRRPRADNVMWKKPRPLSPRRLRFVIDQRITADGRLDPPFRTEDVDLLAAHLNSLNITSAAVCLVNSFLRPDEERRLVEQLISRCPNIMFTASVDLSPEPPEYDRTSTAVVNAYVAPVVATYLSRLEAELRSAGFLGSVFVMQSSGGLMPLDAARSRPVQIIESGPAAGVVACQALARRLQLPRVIAFDMGGTTAKASLLEDGDPLEASDYEVGAGLNARRGNTSGDGYLVAVPSLDIAEIGSGGGSLFWVDKGGSPRVGPRSAGAVPGPACYGLGGSEPTLTDAGVALGYLNPDSIAGGAQRIDARLATRALRTVSEQLGLDLDDAAWGATRIAIAMMTTLVRSITTQRGRDPRDYTLLAFGGSGPIYAVELARELGVGTVIVPLAPGLFSAIGLLVSDRHHDVVRHNPGGALGIDRLRSAFDEMRHEILRVLSAEGYSESQLVFERSLDMKYHDQQGTLRVVVPAGDLHDGHSDLILQRLHDTHEHTYGHRKIGSSAEVTSLRLRATSRKSDVDVFGALAEATFHASAPVDTRRVFFAGTGYVATPVLQRFHLGPVFRNGPMIIEEMDSTIVVPPGARALRDDLGNVLVQAWSTTEGDTAT